jgi:Acetyltransferase (GNAT) domain
VSFHIVHRLPAGPIETRWRACLANSDLPTHYTAPEYFLEPAFRRKKPFAVLSRIGEDLTGVLTGIHDGDYLQSGLSVRPQISLSRYGDRPQTMRNLMAGLMQEAKSAKLVDLFLWPDMATLADSGFRERRYEGVVMLDLSRGPDALFRKFSSNKKINIRKAMRYGVSVDSAKNRDEVSAYYLVYVDWARRKALPIIRQHEFQETFDLTTNRRLFLARYEGHIIAGIVVRFFPGGVMEYAANSSLESGLHLRPNDLLHWRAIEWACAAGLTKYSLGGTHLFLRKFGGEILPTIRHRFDRSLFRQYTVADWIAEGTNRVLPFILKQVVGVGRSCRSYARKLRG